MQNQTQAAGTGSLHILPRKSQIYFPYKLSPGSHDSLLDATLTRSVDKFQVLGKWIRCYKIQNGFNTENGYESTGWVSTGYGQQINGKISRENTNKHCFDIQRPSPS